MTEEELANSPIIRMAGSDGETYETTADRASEMAYAAQAEGVALKPFVKTKDAEGNVHEISPFDGAALKEAQDRGDERHFEGNAEEDYFSAEALKAGAARFAIGLVYPWDWLRGIGTAGLTVARGLVKGTVGTAVSALHGGARLGENAFNLITGDDGHELSDKIGKVKEGFNNVVDAATPDLFELTGEYDGVEGAKKATGAARSVAEMVANVKGIGALSKGLKALGATQRAAHGGVGIMFGLGKYGDVATDPNGPGGWRQEAAALAAGTADAVIFGLWNPFKIGEKARAALKPFAEATRREVTKRVALKLAQAFNSGASMATVEAAKQGAEQVAGAGTDSEWGERTLAESAKEVGTQFLIGSAFVGLEVLEENAGRIGYNRARKAQGINGEMKVAMSYQVERNRKDICPKYHKQAVYAYNRFVRQGGRAESFKEGLSTSPDVRRVNEDGSVVFDDGSVWRADPRMEGGATITVSDGTILSESGELLGYRARQEAGAEARPHENGATRGEQGESRAEAQDRREEASGDAGHSEEKAAPRAENALTLLQQMDEGALPVVDLAVGDIEGRAPTENGNEIAEYDAAKATPIVVLEDLEGNYLAMTGGKRLMMAGASGAETIKAVVVRESDGWTADMADGLNATENLRGGNATMKNVVAAVDTIGAEKVAEIAGWHQSNGSREMASKIRRGLAIAQKSGAELRAALEAGSVSEEFAYNAAQTLSMERIGEGWQEAQRAIAELAGRVGPEELDAVLWGLKKRITPDGQEIDWDAAIAEERAKYNAKKGGAEGQLDSDQVLIETEDGELKTLGEVEAENGSPSAKGSGATSGEPESAEPLYAAAEGAAANRAVELKPVDGKDGTFMTLSHPEARFTVDGERRTLAVDGLTAEDFEADRIERTAALVAKVEAYAANNLLKIGFYDDGVAQLWKTVKGNIAAEGKAAYEAASLEAKRKTLVEQLAKSGLADGGVVETADDFERLFQELSGEALRKGEEVYGFVDPKTKKVYLNPAFFATGQGIEAPIHEFGHLGVIAAEKINKPVYDRGMKLAKELLESAERSSAVDAEGMRGGGVRGLVDFILNDRVYSGQSRKVQAEELLAQLIGKRGEEALRAETDKSVVAKIKSWLVEFWNTFGKALGLKDITPEQAAKMTLEDVADAIRAEMLSGRKYGEGFAGVEFGSAEGTSAVRIATRPARIRRKRTGRVKAVDEFVSRMGGAEDPANTETDMLALWVDNGGRLFDALPFEIETGYSKGASGVKVRRGSVADEFAESTTFYKGLNPAQRAVYFGTGKLEHGSIGEGLKAKLADAGITRFTNEDGTVDYEAAIGEFERQWTNYERGEEFLKERRETEEEHDRAIVEQMEREEAAERQANDETSAAESSARGEMEAADTATEAQIAADVAAGRFSRGKKKLLFSRKGITVAKREFPVLNSEIAKNVLRFRQQGTEHPPRGVANTFDFGYAYEWRGDGDFTVTGRWRLDGKNVKIFVALEKEFKHDLDEASEAYTSRHEGLRAGEQRSSDANLRSGDGTATAGNGRLDILPHQELRRLSETGHVSGSGGNNQGEISQDQGGIRPSLGPSKGGKLLFSRSGIFTGSSADYANRSRQGGVDDGPSVKKIGSGEGAQVYGWGLYGSTERGVAEKYSGMVSVGSPAEHLAAKMRSFYGREDAIRILEERLADKREDYVLSERQRDYHEEAVRLLREGGLPSQNLYEQTWFTNRAPGDESHLLKWYEPVSAEMQSRLLDAAVSEGHAKREGKYLFFGENTMFESGTSQTGEELYSMFKDMFGSPKAASEWLAAHGIDGVKYPVDSYGGKGVKDGDKAGWNYVAFSDENIRVDHKWTDGQLRFSRSSVKPWPKDFPKVGVHTTLGVIKGKYGEEHKKAKAGDRDAAASLIEKVVKPERVRALAARHPNAIVVPVHAEEMSGRNQVPRAYADIIGAITGLQVDDGIVQSVRANHTGANAADRLTRRAEFDGKVEKGREYILVDDHITQGGTLNELRHYIENNGGKVVEVTTLTASQNSTILSVDKSTIDALVRKFGNAATKAISSDAAGNRGSAERQQGVGGILPPSLGDASAAVPGEEVGRKNLEALLARANVVGNLDALTENEARYILKFSPEKLLRVLEDAAASDGAQGGIRPSRGPRPEAEYVNLTRVADDAGVGEQTPGALAASRELSRQAPVPLTTKGTRYVSLPMSEMLALSRYLTGHAMPAEMSTGKKLGGAGKASLKHRKLWIAADVVGSIDKTDLAAEKAMLKQHGFFAHEDVNWVATHSPAEVRKERERSEEALSSRLEKLADRRARGAEPGGMAAGRRVFADQLAKVVMSMPHGQPGVLGQMQTVGGALEKCVNGSEAEAEAFLDWMEGGPSQVARSAQERKAGMFAAFLMMPKEMEARAKGWYDAMRSTIAGDAKLADAFRKMTSRMMSEQGHAHLEAELRRTIDEQYEANVKKLQREAKEPIKAGGLADQAAEKIVLSMDDRGGAAMVRVDAKLRMYQAAQKELMKQAKTPADKAQIKQQTDLFIGEVAQAKNQAELARTALERGRNNEDLRYFFRMVDLINEATVRDGLKLQDISLYLDQQRVIETKGLSGSRGQSTRQAQLALDAMRRRLGGDFARVEAFARRFHAIHEQELLNNPLLEKILGKGTAEYWRSQTHYVTTKRTFSPEELAEIEAARRALAASGAAGGDNVVGQMYNYIGRPSATGRLKGSFADKQEVISATFEKVAEVQKYLRKCEYVIEMRNLLQKAGVEGVHDFAAGKNEFPDNARYGHVNYMENGQKRVLVVPKEIAQGFKAQTTYDSATLRMCATVNGLARQLWIDWNPVYWQRNLSRNAGSIEMNMPGMRESAIKRGLRFVFPGIAPTTEIALTHLVRHVPEKMSLPLRRIWGEHTALFYAPQAKRMAMWLTDHNEMQKRLWDAERRGDLEAVREMEEDKRLMLDALRGNMLVGLGAGKASSATGFLDDSVRMLGKTMQREIKERAADPKWKRALNAINVFEKNAKQQVFEDVMAKFSAYLHDRAQFGKAHNRTAVESGLMVKKNVSIGEGERRGDVTGWTQALFQPFWNMVEKGVVRNAKAYGTRPGETFQKAAWRIAPMILHGLIGSGAVAAWILRKNDGDEEKVKAGPLGEVYGYLRAAQRAYQNCSNYVRENYHVTPLMTDGYTSVVIGMPLTDEERLLKPIARFVTDAASVASGTKEGLDVAQALRDATLGVVAPDFKLAGALPTLLDDTVHALWENPEDYYTGGKKYDNDVWELRNESWEMRGKFIAAMGKRLWNDFGGRNVLPVERGGVDNGLGRAPGWVAKMVNDIPVVSPILRSFVKVQVGSPKRDAVEITEAEERRRAVCRVCAKEMFELARKAKGDISLDRAKYDGRLAKWKERYNLADEELADIEGRYLNAWRSYEGAQYRADGEREKFRAKAEKLGLDAAHIWLDFD